MTSLLLSASAGTKSTIVRTTPAGRATYDLNFIATGTNAGDKVDVFGSGTMGLDDFQPLGTITLAANAFNATISGSLCVTCAWERVYAQADGGNAGKVNAQLMTNI